MRRAPPLGPYVQGTPIRPIIEAWLTANTGLSWAGWLIPTATAANATAVLVGQALFISRLTRLQTPVSVNTLMAFAAGIGGLFGARLFYLAQRWLLIGSTQPWLSGSFQGTASWGVYLGSIVSIYLLCRMLKIRFTPVADIAASCAGASVAVGRIACLLAGDDFGSPTSSRCSIAFPPGSLAYSAQLREGLIPFGAPSSLPVHPVQLYLAALGAVLFIVTSYALKRFSDRPGFTFSLYWVLYLPTRFLLEFLRGDQLRVPPVGLTVPQCLCALALVPATINLCRVLHDPVKRGPSSP